MPTSAQPVAILLRIDHGVGNPAGMDAWGETPPESDHASLARAWARHEEEVRAVTLSSARHPNIDALYVGSQVGRVAVRIAPYRERFLLELPLFRIQWLDELPSLALATIWTGAQASAIPKTPALAGPLLVVALEQRRRLAAALCGELAFAETPTQRRVPKLTGRGPAHFAGALEGMVIALRELGFDRTPARKEELAAAEALVVRLMKASGPREEASPALVAARELRAKALVLLRKRYDEIRAAVLYVGRAEPGVARVMPSFAALRLHGVRRGRKKAPAGEPPAK